MRKNPTLEWETMLDDAEWHRAESLSRLLADRRKSQKQPRMRTSRSRQFALLALMIVAAVAAVVWYEARTGVAAIEAELQQMAAAETWIDRSGDIDAGRSLVDSEADNEWQDDFVRRVYATSSAAPGAEPHTVAVENLRLRTGAAMAQVVVTDASGAALRETRFYRETPAGWMRTEPLAVFWGAERLLETDYFSLQYHQIDEQAVAQAASRLDEIARRLYADLGLALPNERLDVVVAPPSSQSLGLPYVRDGRVAVPSPASMQTPANLSDADILAYIVTKPLVEWVWREAHRQAVAANPNEYGEVSSPYWQHVRSGIRIWQTLAGSEASVYGFLMIADAPSAAAAGTNRAFDVGVDARPCPQNVWWRYGGATAVQVAAWCRDARWQKWLPNLRASRWTLDHLASYDEWDVNPVGPEQVGWIRAMTAASVVDYLVHTYGREQLPLFIEGMGAYDSWHTLIPELFGISAEEFERGWQAYVDDLQ